MKKFLLLGAILFACSLSASAAPSPEAATARYLASIQDNSQKIKQFMREIPKGGDLHNHASGSTFAEKMVEYAAADNLCVNRSTFTVFANGDCPEKDLLNNAVKDVQFYDGLIDAWSMQHFWGGKESGHDHFFKTFTKFKEISHHHTGEILAEIADRAASQHELYVETMITADGGQSGQLGKKLGWNPDFSTMRARLLASNFDQIIKDMTNYLDASEAKMRSILGCGTANAKAGCNLTLRYQYQVARENPPEMVFAQLLAGFEGASKEKRIVAVNMVMPEDGTVSMRDYKLHMQMVNYFHQLYPNVHITLHAGELNNEVAPEEGLRFHINDAVMTGKAERIGHGADIAHENDYPQLLTYMADHHIMVEINLSSNAGILKMEGSNHPLPLYLQYGVPVALSTDDEGVTRDILTTEYVKAVTTYHLDYVTLKSMIRNSISYGFLPGENLWQDHDYRRLAAPCAGASFDRTLPASCKTFLTGSEKARLQWELEQRLNQFESQFSNRG